MPGLTALAGVEARRLLRHPFVLAGLALAVVAVATGARRDGQTQTFLLMGLAVISGFISMGLRETALLVLARKGLQPATA